MLLPSEFAVLFELPEMMVHCSSGSTHIVGQLASRVWLAGRHGIEDVVCHGHNPLYAGNPLQPCPSGQDLRGMPT